MKKALIEEREKKLIKACLRGKRKAQRSIYDEHSRVMYALCLRYASSREEAEDILQEGFLKVFRDLHQYKPIAPLGAWIRKVMVNTALEHIRKRKSRVNALHDIEEQRHLASENHSDLETDDLLKLVKELPEDYRLVFNLAAIEGYSHQEIAEKLNISESNSKVRLNRARKMLQAKLELVFEIEK